MILEEALKQYRLGKKVKRKAYSDTNYLQINEKSDFVLTTESILADDWEVMSEFHEFSPFELSMLQTFYNLGYRVLHVPEIIEFEDKKVAIFEFWIDENIETSMEMSELTDIVDLKFYSIKQPFTNIHIPIIASQIERFIYNFVDEKSLYFNIKELMKKRGVGV